MMKKHKNGNKGEVIMKNRRVACVIPPFYKLLGSKNNRLTPAMHYIAETLYRSGYEICYINGDYAGDDVSYADRSSLTVNSWVLDKKYFVYHPSFSDIIEKLKEFQPDTVIIGAGDVLIPTVEFGNNHISAYLSKRIKIELGDHIHCIGYGHLLKYISDEEQACFDTCISCEGESIINEVVEKRRIGNYTNVWTNDLDNLPILTSEYMHQSLKPQDWDYILSMRGCPHRCSFCLQSNLRNGRLSFRSAEHFLTEIWYRIKEIGTRKFYFSDAVFLPGKNERTKQMLRMLKELKEEVPDFSWWAEARVNVFEKVEDYVELKKAGCSHLKFGVESGNQEMLNRFHKQIKLDDVKQAFRLSSQAGLERSAYILLGCPGFADKDYRDTYQFFKDLQADNYVVNILVPYQGTKLHDELKNQLYVSNLYLKGEEGFMHNSLTMKKFWNISDETLKLFFSLQKEKEDFAYRDYLPKIIDRQLFETDRKWDFIK